MSAVEHFNKKNPCPVCGGTSGCKEARDTGIMCFRIQENDPVPDGWKRTHTLSRGMGSILVPLDADNPPILPPRSQPKFEKTHYVGLSPTDRHCQYTSLIKLLPDLNRQQIQELADRGLTKAEIQSIGFFPWSAQAKTHRMSPLLPGVRADGCGLMGASGIVIPAKDCRNQIIAGQILPTNKKLSKYTWLSSRNSRQDPDVYNSRPGPSLENGELPLFHVRHPDTWGGQVKEIWLCEGGLKPYIAASVLWRNPDNRAIAFIGAAGNQFGLEQLQHTLKQWEPERVVLAPDAGAVMNAYNIPGFNFRVLDALKEWGYDPEIAWWGQTHKTDSHDIDDLLVANPSALEGIEFIDTEAFFALHPVAMQKKLRPGASNHPEQYEAVKSSGHYQAGQNLLEGDIQYFEAHERTNYYRQTYSSKFIQDKTGTGLGKSYAAGNMEPEELDAEQLIYVTNDPINPTTEPLELLPAIRGRDNGRKATIVNDVVEWRRGDPGDGRGLSANCARTDLAALLPKLGIEANSDHLCKGCMHRGTCAGSSSGYSYLFQKKRATSAPHYIAHPNSLPSGV